MNDLRILVVVVCVAAAGLLPLGAQASAATRHSPSVTVLASTDPRTIHPNGVITFHLRVRGIRLVPKFGKRLSDRQGHVQVYLDRIPKDAYTKVDLRHGWLASVAATTFTLRFPLAALGSKRSRHTILIALAKNNNVLYRAEPAAVGIMVR